jgi:nondiscriminating glutamyl-tRNA synthetase
MSTVSNSASHKPVRVRFAPSPTGYLHVGGARTLLFNWLFAKHHGGTLILRIEDTDQVRSTKESERMLLSDIERLGIDYQEGPDKAAGGGPYPPYRQSERLGIYAEYARKLLESGRAYYCFCSEELLTEKRDAALKAGGSPHYDGTCRQIAPTDAKARLARGEKAGLRFHAFDKSYVLDDHVRGRVEFKAGMVGDFFITRTPKDGEGEIASGIGFPVYNFCCVIDDHLMKISHVIRAEEHLSNTPRQLQIYDAFGWEMPEFAHVSLVLGSDRSKLSKRNGDTSVYDYLDKGYLPDAFLNFLVLLGWGISGEYKPKSGHPEVLTRDEMIKLFGLGGLQGSPAVFDMQKLQWMNGYYLRAAPIDEIVGLAKPYFQAYFKDTKIPNSPSEENTGAYSEWFKSLIQVTRAGDVSLLSDLPKAAETLLQATPSLETDAKTALSDPLATQVVDSLIQELNAAQESLTSTDVDAIQKKVGGTTGAKGKSLFMTMRAVITGKTHGPDLKLMIPLLGKATAVKRIQAIRQQAGV